MQKPNPQRDIKLLVYIKEINEVLPVKSVSFGLGGSKSDDRLWGCGLYPDGKMETFDTNESYGDRVMEFTGKQDKSGLDIYEGHILAAWVGKGKDRKQLLHEVKWNPDQCRFDLPSPLGRFEIITNIYKDPDLIEATK